MTLRLFKTLYLINLHSWIYDKRRKFKFLWGRGGSGKTKIAYEIAEILRESPSSLLMAGVQIAEKVLFLTAKETEFRTADSTLQNITNKSDFSTARTLAEAILYESKIIQKNEITDFSELSDRKIEDLLFEAFREEAFFIVVDDIDTLTTNREDSGLSLLQQAVYQSPLTSKVLITQRNEPIDFIADGLKIEGFKTKEEIQKFLELCCAKFDVEHPDNVHIEEITKLSEGIPLIIESIVGIRRGFDSWNKAIEKYSETRGKVARQYMHQREFDAIKDPRSRLLLVALSFFKTQTDFDTLKHILACTEEQLESSIAETFNMFINQKRGPEGKTEYILTESSNKFILNIAPDQPHYEKIKARFGYKIKGKQPEPKGDLKRIIQKLEKALKTDYLEKALTLIDFQSDPKIEQNPHYMNVCAQIYANAKPPKVTEARAKFEDCLNCGHLTPRAARTWVNMEKDKEQWITIKDKITPAILDNSRNSSFHSEFYEIRKYAQKYIAKDISHTDMNAAYDLFDGAFHDAIQSWKYINEEKYRELKERKIKSSFFNLVDCSLEMGTTGYPKLIESIKSVSNKFSKFDFSIIGPPLLKFLKALDTERAGSSASGAAHAHLVSMKKLHRDKIIRTESAVFEGKMKKYLGLS